MKTLIITNMRPSRQQPYSGIFVINQYRKLGSMPGGPDVSLFTMERRFTGPVGSFIKYAAAFFRFLPYLFRRYDIVHLHFFYPLILLVWLYRGIHPRSRLVVTFHGSDVVSHIQGRWARRFFGRLARGTDYRIAVSHDLADTVTEKLGARPHRVMCAGVDRALFYKRADLPKDYDFIFAGSLTRHKGADLFIEALGLLDRPDIRVCVAGSGPYLEAFRALGGKYRVEVHERQDQRQLGELFNRSRFLVMPSRQESFGLVVTEAMYCGTPVIASYLGGLKEQIDEPRNGWFVRELNGPGLRVAMARALDLPGDAYAAMAKAASTSNEAFSLETVCRETVEIYRALTGTGAQPQLSKGL